MQKGNQHCWLWLMLLLSYKFLLVKGAHCYCSNYVTCSNDKLYTSTRQSINKMNVALGKPSNQSSYHTLIINKPVCGNDGNRRADFAGDKPICIHTEDFDNNPYYMIDLLKIYPINYFTIYWREELLRRANHVRVLLDGLLCFNFSKDIQYSDPTSFNCVQYMSGRYVKLERRLSETEYLLQNERVINVCEVEVWVCWPGFYGHHCQNVCETSMCGDNTPCDPRTGICLIPLDQDMGLQGPISQKALVKATRKPTTESTIIIQEGTEAPTTTIKPPEECLNWIYAICIMVVCILITVGINLYLKSSQRAKEKDQNKLQDEGQATRILDQSEGQTEGPREGPSEGPSEGQSEGQSEGPSEGPSEGQSEG